MKRLICLTIAALALPALAAAQADADEALFKKKCTLCHPADRINQFDASKAGWEATVKRMQATASGLISDAEAKRLIEENPRELRPYLTRISNESCRETTEAYWKLGDLLWTKYDEKW